MNDPVEAIRRAFLDEIQYGPYRTKYTIFSKFCSILRTLGHEAETANGIDHTQIGCPRCGERFSVYGEYIVCDNGEKARKIKEANEKRVMIMKIQQHWWASLTPEEQQTEIALWMLMPEA